MADGKSRHRRSMLPLRVLIPAAAAVLGWTAMPQAAEAQYKHNISTIALDASTGNVLSQVNPDLQRYPASLTKLMTLYLAFEALRQNRISLDQDVPVSIHAASMEPSKLGLMPGSYLTVEQAVLGLVTKSANDAASALGEMLSGGDEGRFGQMMTLKARSLGMSNTTFRNASGLPDPEQVTTARDLALLARHLITDYPEYYHYFSVPAFMFHGREVPNHDPMLRIYAGADGLKTGYTQEAGHNLVTSAVRGNVRLVGVVLGASSNPQRSAVMASLLNDGFQQEGVPVPAQPPRISSGLVLASAHGAAHSRRRATAFAAAHLRRHDAPAGAGPQYVAAHGRGRLHGARVHLVGATAVAHVGGHGRKSRRHGHVTTASRGGDAVEG